MRTHAIIFAVTAALHHVLCVAAWPWGENIKHLVQFGDSYTDSTVYVVTNGTTWGEYLADYANFSLNNFAISGATCDNRSTPRTYPDVTHNELGAYFNFTMNGTTSLPPDETLYTLWIGTNDVGVGELLTGQATSGVSIVNVSQCAVNWIQTLYDSGARRFLFQNMLPLDKVPLYQADSYPDKYWTADRNTTEWNVFMKELVAAGNALTHLMIQLLHPKLENATIGYFDSYGFFNDIYENPAKYLNGTAPLNVTGSSNACGFATNEATNAGGTCTIASGTDRDSFLWVDELHPSEQADRQLAQHLYRVYTGNTSEWVTFYGAV